MNDKISHELKKKWLYPFNSMYSDLAEGTEQTPRSTVEKISSAAN
jgi:hypothetical protein